MTSARLAETLGLAVKITFPLWIRGPHVLTPGIRKHGRKVPHGKFVLTAHIDSPKKSQLRRRHPSRMPTLLLKYHCY